MGAITPQRAKFVAGAGGGVCQKNKNTPLHPLKKHILLLFTLPQNKKKQTHTNAEGRVYGGLGMDDDVMAPDDNGRRRDPGAIVRDLKEFVQTHFAHDRRGADEPLAYRQQLNKDPTRLVVDLVHVRMHNPSLGAELEAKPAEYLPLVSLRDDDVDVDVDDVGE